MNKVFFNNVDSYEDLGLVLTGKTISTPDAKTTTVDIPGGDGVIDFTEYFGSVSYKNRKLTFEFLTSSPKNSFLVLFSRVQNLFHGKKVKIVLSDDPEFYYLGRAAVNEWKSDKRIGKIIIEVDAEPYKYKTSVTTMAAVVSSQKNIVCFNLKKAVVPKIIVTGEVTVKFGNYQTTILNGNKTDDNIVFIEGQNVLTLTPAAGTTANVVVEYQERGL